MSKLKKLAGQTAIYGISSIAGRFLNYLLVPLYTYNFTPAEYGVVTEMYAYVAFLVVVLTYGLETAFFRFSSEDGIDKESVYSTSIFSILSTTSVFVSMVLFFSTDISSALELQGRNPSDISALGSYKRYIEWFALVIGLDVFSAIPFARLRAENKAIRFAVIKLLNIGSNIFLNLFFILLCPYALSHEITLLSPFIRQIYDPEMGVGYIFISNLVASAITILLLLPEILKTRKNFDSELWKKMMAYSLPLLMLGIAGVVNETIDRVMLKYLLPVSFEGKMQALGIYGACYKISIVMTIAIQAFRYAAEPFFFSMAKEKDARESYAYVMKYFVIVCSFIFLATMVYIDILKYFVSSNFHEGLAIVPILLIANLCLGVYYNLSIWFKLTDKTMYGAYISIAGAILTLVLNYIFIPQYGYMASAWATLACYGGMMFVSWLIGQRFYPVPYAAGRMSFYVLFAIGIYFALDMLKPTNFFMQYTIGTASLMAYSGIIFWIERKKNRA